MKKLIYCTMAGGLVFLLCCGMLTLADAKQRTERTNVDRMGNTAKALSATDNAKMDAVIGAGLCVNGDNITADCSGLSRDAIRASFLRTNKEAGRTDAELFWSGMRFDTPTAVRTGSVMPNGFTAPQSTHNTCPGAIPLGGGTSDNTCGSGIQDPNCNSGTGDPVEGLWYTLAGSGNTISLSTCNQADYDTAIDVSCPECVNPVCVAGNDDGPGCSGFTSFLSFCSEAGAEYDVFLNGFTTGDCGNFLLTVTDDGIPCNNPNNGTGSCLPPEPQGACCVTTPGFPESCGNCAETSEPDCQGVDQEWNDGLPCAGVGPTVQFGCTDCPRPIPDGGPQIQSTINVPAGTGFVADAQVQLDVSGTFMGDLEIFIHHAGTEVQIWSHDCGAGGGIRATASDAGTETGCIPIENGPSNAVFFAPEDTTPAQFLSDFDGGLADGDWDLRVEDTFPADNNTVDDWQIIIELQGDPTCEAVPCPTGGGGDDDDSDDSA